MKQIAVFDDHPIIKLTLEYILSTSGDKFRFSEVPNSKALVKLVNERKLDLLFFDVNYPGEDTQKLLVDCLMIYPELKVLVFSANQDTLFGKRFIKLGAKGYINKAAEPQEIVKAVDTVLAGKKYFSQALLEQISDQAIYNKPDNPFDGLTTREFEIAMYLVKGLSSSEIASNMNIQMSTVATYKHRIFEKLEVNNAIEMYELYNSQNP